MTMATTHTPDAQAIGPEHPDATRVRLTAEIEQLRAERDRLRRSPIEANDPRLSDLWAQAHEIAEAHGNLSEYATLAESLGIEVARESFSAHVAVHITQTHEVHIPLTGFDADRAWFDFLHSPEDERRAAVVAAGIDIPEGDTRITFNRGHIAPAN